MERFVARAAELAHLDEAYRRAQAGKGSVTVILAEAGGGKTRLVDEFAAASEARLAWGRSVEDTAVPYRSWRQAFRRLDIPFPLPDEASSAGTEDRAGRLLEIAEDVIAALAPASEERAVVIALDDLQWADDASLHLLRLLAAEVAHLRVMVLATARHPEPGSPLEGTLGALTGRAAVTVLSLPPLSAADVAEYLFGRSDADAAVWVHRQSGGNPLYVRELGRLLADEPLPLDPSATWLPVELRALLRRRLGQLDESVLEVAGAASVLGDEFSVQVLEEVVGRRLKQEMQLAVERGIVVVDLEAPGVARFSHGLVRTALYSGLPSARRVDLHRRATVVLERAGALEREDQLGELALHWLRAASTPDERTTAVHRLRQAARVATRRLAYDEATPLLRSASATARLGPAGVDERAEIEVELADAEFHAGFVVRAVETGRRAVELAEQARRPDLAASAALVVSGIGDSQTQPALLSLKERALQSMPSELGALRVRLEAQIARLQADLHSPAAAEAASIAALEAAEALGDHEALVDAIEARHFVCSGPDGLVERDRLSSRMIELGRDPRGLTAAMWGHLWRIDAANERGDLARADAGVADLARVVERLRRPMAEWHLLMVRAGSAIPTGRFDEGERLALEARRLGHRLEDFSVVGVTYAITGEIARLRGSTDEQAERAALVERVSYPIAKVDTAFISVVLGDVDTARRLHDQVKPFILTLPFNGRWLPTMCLFAQTACELRDTDHAEHCYTVLLPYASRCVAGGAGSVTCQGSVSVVLGRLAALLGRPQDADRHFAHGAAENRRIGVVPYLGETLLHWSKLLASTDPAAARPLAEEANAIATRLGMAVVARESAAVLEGLSAGGRPERDPLTRRERGLTWSYGCAAASIGASFSLSPTAHTQGGTMHARLQTVRAMPDRFNNPEAARYLIKVLEGHPGFRSVHLMLQIGSRQGLNLTLWESREDAEVAPARTRAVIGPPPFALDHDEVYGVVSTAYGATALEAATVCQVTWFDGPRSAAQVEAMRRAGEERIRPAVEPVPGFVATYVLCQPADSAVVVVTLATSTEALERITEAVFSTSLLPGEDTALLTDPDRVELYKVENQSLAGVPVR